MFQGPGHQALQGRLPRVYVDAAADLPMAEEIAFNAKMWRQPAVCNAMETLLIDKAIARPQFCRASPSV